MNLVEQEKKRRELEAKGNRGMLTPAQAQEPTVLTNSPKDFRAPSSSAVQTTYSRQQPSQTPAPSQAPAPQVTPTRTRGAAVDAFDPNSGKERPEELGFWRGWIRDRVRENLKDENGDGRYEVPFWLGTVNSGVNLVTPGKDRTNREIADNKRNQDRDEQSRAIARGSGVQDQIPMDENRYYDPDEIKARVDQINRGREVGDAEDVQQQELEVIDRSNAPTLEQIASGERQNRDTNQTNLTLGRENNQSAEDMNSDNNQTTRRGQDNERDISLLGMENDLDLAEIQRLAGQDQITAQNQLANLQYQQQLQMWQMDRDDRKEERREDRGFNTSRIQLIEIEFCNATYI